MGIDADSPHTVHAGTLVARRLRASGIDTVFTLSGGHIFPIYDGCRSEGIRLIDTRHEQTAAFAAEGWSKVTRVPGVVALTAGPGVTNGMSAMAAAQQNQSPMLVLAGRAPALRWGMGSLQEIDHVPFVAPLARYAVTAESAGAVGDRVDDALRAAAGAPSGVAFVDFPMDHLFGEAHDRDEPGALRELPALPAADGLELQRAVELLSAAQRPVIMAGTNVWWGHAEEALLELAEKLRIPVFANGMARGIVGADRDLAFSRARSQALSQADVAVVVGVPMDFRLGFGAVFGNETRLIVADRVAPDRDHPRAVAAGLYGDLSTTLAALATASAGEHEDWIGSLRTVEARARAAEAEELADERTPLHPMRVYAELHAAAGPRRDRRDRRRRLRLLRGPGHRQLRARRLAGQRAVRLPGIRARLCAGRQAGPARPAGGAVAGRRRVRLLRHGVGHAGSPWRACGFGDRQQRDLGAGEASDGDALRLLGGRRAATGHPLRRGGDAHSAATASWSPRPRNCGRHCAGPSRRDCPRWSTR